MCNIHIYIYIHVLAANWRIRQHTTADNKITSFPGPRLDRIGIGACAGDLDTDLAVSIQARRTSLELMLRTLFVGFSTWKSWGFDNGKQYI